MYTVWLLPHWLSHYKILYRRVFSAFNHRERSTTNKPGISTTIWQQSSAVWHYSSLHAGVSSTVAFPLLLLSQLHLWCHHYMAHMVFLILCTAVTIISIYHFLLYVLCDETSCICTNSFWFYHYIFSTWFKCWWCLSLFFVTVAYHDFALHVVNHLNCLVMMYVMDRNPWLIWCVCLLFVFCEKIR